MPADRMRRQRGVDRVRHAASQVHEFGVRGIVTRSQELGRAIRGIRTAPRI